VASVGAGAWRVLGAVALLLGGCGGSETPAELCSDFVGAYCDKAASCELASERSRTEKDCAFYFEVNAPCSELTTVQSSVASCLHDVAATDCADSMPGYWPAIPYSCSGLVKR
jgi:hypothetical protein